METLPIFYKKHAHKPIVVVGGAKMPAVKFACYCD